eukprot:m.28762 g.28762  ORF g.28762 m.28762 type:complete len:94 (-) comp9503_c0_seq2:223-504(-)
MSGNKSLWFKPSFSRQEAEEYLKKFGAGRGLFVIRRKSIASNIWVKYAITQSKGDGTFIHALVSEQNMVVCASEGQNFNSLEALVAFYAESIS